MNSRQKGARGEREWRDFLIQAGLTARRGQQFSGNPEAPDVVCPSTPGVHWEVKRVEAGNPYVWLDQARRDAGDRKIPIVAHRKNQRDWICILPALDVLNLLKRAGLVHETAQELPAPGPVVEGTGSGEGVMPGLLPSEGGFPQPGPVPRVPGETHAEPASTEGSPTAGTAGPVRPMRSKIIARLNRAGSAMAHPQSARSM